MMKHKKLIYLLCMLPLASAGQEVLTLEKCRELALMYNPVLKAQQKTIESTEANIMARKKDYYPELDINGNYTYLQKPVQVILNQQQFDGVQQAYGISAPLVQNVYQGSSVKNMNEMALHQKEYAESEKSTTEDRLVMQTEIAFWAGIYGMELHKLSNQYKESIDGLVKVIKDKVDYEIISRNDLLLLEVRQNEAELFQLVTLNNLRTSLMDLNRLIGFPIDTLVNLSGDLSYIYDTLAAFDLDKVFSSRPEIASQQKRILMQETNSKLVKATYLPQVYVGVIPEWGAPNTNLGGSDPMYNTAVMAGVNVPLVHWGQRAQDVKKELMLAESDRYKLQELKDEITLELNSSGYQLYESMKRVELTKNSLAKAEENLAIMTDRYLEGLTSILEVLDAQLYWQKAYKDMLDAQVYYKQSWIFYRRACGII